MSFIVWPILIFQLIFLIWALGKWDERDYFKTAMHGAYAVINYFIMSTLGISGSVLGTGDKNHQHMLFKNKEVSLETVQ